MGGPDLNMVAAQPLDWPEEVDGPEAEADDPDASHWHKRNKQYKRKAGLFAGMQFLPELAVLSEVSRHLQNLRDQLFQRAALAWRRRAYAKSIGADSPAPCSKLLEILKGDDVAGFFRGVFSSLAIPPPLLDGARSTQAAQALMFSSLTRAVHVFNICVSYLARKACFQKL